MPGQDFTACRATISRDAGPPSGGGLLAILKRDNQRLSSPLCPGEIDGGPREVVHAKHSRDFAADGREPPRSGDRRERRVCALVARLYPGAALRRDVERFPEPDFAEVARELTRKHVTRRQLWREYRARYPAGLGYTASCVHYRRWRATIGAELAEIILASDVPQQLRRVRQRQLKLSRL
jgi:hypothetical protein